MKYPPLAPVVQANVGLRTQKRVVRVLIRILNNYHNNQLLLNQTLKVQHIK